MKSLVAEEHHVHGITGQWVLPLLVNLGGYAVILCPLFVLVWVVKSKKRFVARLRTFKVVKVLCYGKNAWPSDDQSRALELDFFGQSAESDLSVEEKPKVARKLDEKRILLLLGLFAGKFISYLIYGVLQERITVRTYRTGWTEESQNSTKSFYFEDSQFIVFSDRLVSILLSAVVISSYKLVKPTSRQATMFLAPYYTLAIVAGISIVSSWCQQEALRYIDFPTKVLSKSFKIVPVMLIGHFCMKFVYKASDYIVVIAISVGAAIFMVEYAQNNTQHAHELIQNYNLYDGLAILAIFVIFDSVNNNYRGSVFRRFSPSSWEAMAVENLFVIGLTMTSLVSGGTLIDSMKLAVSSRLLLRDIVVMSLTNAMGQACEYFTMANFGPLVTVVLVTIREISSIFVSCFLYGHKLTPLACTGIFVIFGAIISQAICKIIWQRKKDKGSVT